MEKRRPPVGIDSFEQLREADFYYIDKTGLIRELLSNWGAVNLFTRPRRFGKSLNMSMLKSFFEIGTDKSLFDGLAISKEIALCEEYMGRFPVISITLKQVKGLNYASAETQMWTAISMEAERLSYLASSDRLDDTDKQLLNDLRLCRGNLPSALLQLSRLLCKHYQQKVIILIDEYDVPLQKAEANGYYAEMAELISQLFGYGMKTNSNMLFSVVTGCLRIAKESIFTGFNNPKVHTVVDDQYDEWFGFTDAEVQEMLAYYGLSEYYEITKEWYDGYRFGSVNVYCPWDVINWCEQLRRSKDHTPRDFWANTSSNDMILRFVELADETTRAELEELSEGKSIDKELRLDLTYAELDQNIDHLWGILFSTGYLTYTGRNEDGSYQLKIPNREINHLFGHQIKDWFQNRVEGGLQPLFRAFDEHCAADIENAINTCLTDSISFMDGGNTDEVKETFYHGLLLGLLRGRRGWRVKSNREAGNGRADIILIDRTRQCGHIIEVKYARNSSLLTNRAQTALRQIDDRAYDEYFSNADISEIYHYGIAFCQKRCRVADIKDALRLPPDKAIAGPKLTQDELDAELTKGIHSL
ncbi:MAG: ATP-binding protein [Lachnospiraceae bacterium]|nr:ATP-binding protein [Lachnospiraceae bacterium]